MCCEDERRAVEKDEERPLPGLLRLGSVEFLLKAAQQFGCLLRPSSGLQFLGVPLWVFEGVGGWVNRK